MSVLVVLFIINGDSTWRDQRSPMSVGSEILKISEVYEYFVKQINTSGAYDYY